MTRQPEGPNSSHTSHLLGEPSSWLQPASTASSEAEPNGPSLDGARRSLASNPPVAAVVGRIGSLLDSLADALAEGRLDRLLTTDRELGNALGALRSADPVDHGTLSAEARFRVGAEIERCRVALDRCRRLGAFLHQLTAVTLAVTCRSGAYTREGGAPMVTPNGTLEARG